MLDEISKWEEELIYSGDGVGVDGKTLVIGGIDTEDGTGGDGGVDVGGTVKRVEDDNVVARVALLHGHWHVLFL